MARANARVTVSYNMDTLLIGFTFVSDGSVLHFDVSRLIEKTLFDTLEPTVQTAIFHGFNQKLRDVYAGLKEDADIKKKLINLIQSLESGAWKAPRQGSEATAEALQKLSATREAMVQTNINLIKMMPTKFDISQVTVMLAADKDVANLTIEALKAEHYFDDVV